MRPEILAPAGSMDALKAAVHAGADAVYLGGSRYGARAYADNFDEPTLIQAIEYAHIYGVKVYLTVNTLFRNEEMKGLYAYLEPYYRAGLDAVIVQDFGVMYAISVWFPDLPIHASTQMTITTPYAYNLLKDYGVTRIVPARELSIEEIARLKQYAAIPEVEVFVQGALCYCYSGQCLMSSFIGGRSGNRGRCAQPCRLPYQLKDADGNRILTKGEYLLSPKDLCGLEAVPDLIRAGVDSFKIEGRMKKPEYVAVCTRAYRTMTDAVIEGNDTKPLIEQLRSEMAEVFNRGGFTKGYYYQKNGADMMSTLHNGHCGVPIGTIQMIKRNQAYIRLSQNVGKGDILVVPNGKESITLTCNVEERAGQEICLNLPKTKEPIQGKNVLRVMKQSLEQELGAYANEEKEIFLSGSIQLRLGKNAEMVVSVIRNGEEIRVTVEGDCVEQASARPLAENVVREKITQTGGTRYRFTDLKILLDEDVFYPLKSLKELRRQAISKLEEQILQRDKRTCLQKDTETILQQRAVNVSEQTENRNVIFVSTKEQLATASEQREHFARIYIDMQYFDTKDIEDMIRTKQKVYYALPAVLRSAMLQEWNTLSWKDMYGVVIRNLDELAYLKLIGFPGKVITDYSVYAMNDIAAGWLQQQFPEVIVTLPVELNQKQLQNMNIISGELEVYGYQQLMVSAQCVQNTTGGCNGNNTRCYLTDRLNKQFFVASVCKYCYNLIYNGIPTVVFDIVPESMRRQLDLRLHFINETKEQTETIIRAFLEQSAPEGEKTRGHFKRGVE